MNMKIIDIKDSNVHYANTSKHSGAHFTQNVRFEKYFLSHKEEFETLDKLIKEHPENMTYKKLMVMSVFSSLEMIASGVIEYVKPYIIPLLLNRLSDNEENNDPSEKKDHDIDYSILFTFCAADDKIYRIDDSGLIKIEKLKVSLRDKLLFSIQLLFKIRNQTLNPKMMEGWVGFLKAIRIRDRIMHPKKLSDLDVSHEDYLNVLETNKWIQKCILHEGAEE
jgi:hypothetical protein